MKVKKIILVGSGAVGNSFLYAAMNRGIAQEYGIIDVNDKVAQGNVLDMEDAIATAAFPFNVFHAQYSDCKDADIVVITAGRPQLPGETRIDMVEGNSKIMKAIATEIKKSGFKGITVIASNPVDVLTYVYQQVTGFDKNKVVGSGTSLDTARFVRILSQKLDVATSSIQAYVLGEHGDSSVSVFSSATVSGKPLSDFEKDGKIDPKKYPKIHETVYRKAYEIIDRKGATFYGIGSALANICFNILTDSKKVLMVGAYLNGEYKNKGLYTGVPAIVGINGVESIIEVSLSNTEQDQFNKSCALLEEVIKKAEIAIK
ncbi:MAG: L-lactate dehydrogenase [Metamycoplasmataceae bacterium]